MAGIVVGLDGSPHAERALRWAMNEAALRHARLRVVSVCQAARGRAGFFGGPRPGDDELLERTRSAAQVATDKALAALGGARPDVSVEAVLGVAAEVLLDTAADAEMIVVGSRGAGGFERLTMGSVGDQVARHARCPVVIVPRERAS